MNSPRTWIELDSSAFDHNIAQYKKVIQDRFLAVVVKANAYGHGMIEVSQLAQKNPSIHMLCVAALSEALILRSNGITKPILVLSTIDDDIDQIAHNNMHIAVFNKSMVDQLNSMGRKNGTLIPVHLKIDTGLSRLGVTPEHAQELLDHIATLSNISLVGIYSHFAESSNSDQSYTLTQVERFKKLLAKIKPKVPYIHLANSAGTSSLDLPFCTMFRVGCGIYGAWPSPANKKITQERYPDFTLKPILTWKTRINCINTIAAGSPIGYDRTFIATRDTTIATLPIGYYDGYDFRLFNQGSVFVNGSYAPIIGRISMNVMTIDITDIANAKEGDTVTLIGPQPPIDAYSLGMLAGNPNVREILTKINAVIPRKIIPSIDLTLEKLYSFVSRNT
jgi:alanine racemase